MIRSRSGQSLIDVLLAAGLGAILLVGSLAVLAPALRGSRDAESAQDGAAAARGLMDGVRSLAASDWDTVASLTDGAPYHLQHTATGSTPVAGVEGSSVMVSRFTLDETTTSSAANSAGGPIGTGFGGLTVSSTCMLSGCWGFNGSDAYIAAPAISGLSAVQSVTFWIKKTGDGYIVDMGGNNNWVQVLGSKIRAGSTPGGGYWDSNATLTNNTWYFVAVTRGSDNVQKIYINGVLDRSDTMSGTATPSTLTFGRYGGAVQYLYTGLIDDVRIYNSALSASEVERLYTGSEDVSISRSFAVYPVYRTSGGAITSSGGYEDPSTLRVVVTYTAPFAAPRTISSLITRSRAQALVQTDWAGGPGLGTTTFPGAQFASSTGMDYLTTTGSFAADLDNLINASSTVGSGTISATPAEHYAWNDFIGWINFYSSGNVTLSSSRLRGYANSAAGPISFDCATSPSGNICGSGSYYVTNNGLGTLAGWAWNDTYGWISFSSTNHGGSVAYGVSVNPSTGVFSGYAWNDLIGWISFNCADIAICGVSDYKVVTGWRASSGYGLLDSAIIDTGIDGSGAQVAGLTWTGSEPAGSDARFQIATANSASGPWSYVGPDGTGTSYYAPNPSTPVALYPWAHPAGRYFRYRTTLVTDVAQAQTPRVDDVIVRWSP